MAKILIVSIPMYGHVYPTLALTRELVERGHDVTYLIGEKFRDKVEHTGANVVTYEMTEEGSAESFLRYMPGIYEKAFKMGHDFQCLIYEMGFLLGHKLGEELGIKTVCLTSTFALDKNVTSGMPKDSEDTGNKLSNAIVKAFGLKDKIQDEKLKKIDIIHECLGRYPGLTIVYTSRDFQIHDEDFDENKFIFVGPSVEARYEHSNIPFEEMHGKIIYISLGSISSSISFLKTCIEAFKDMNVSVIMTSGKGVNIEDLGAIPDNFYVYPFVEQIEVLKHVDLFITHCGMNSANESMYFGVPVIAVPQRGDQPIVAKRMEELGLGELINKNDVTVQNLVSKVSNVLNDSYYRENMSNMSKKMKSAGGYKKAADEIEKYIGVKSLVMNP